MSLTRALLFAGLLAGAGCATHEADTSLTGEYLAGRLAARVNAIDDAAAAYSAAHEAAPGQVDILRDAFFYHLAAGEIDAAAPYAEKLVAIGGEASNDGLARTLLAARALKQGRLRQARAILNGPMETPFVKSVGFLTDVWIEAGLAGPESAMARLENPDTDIFAGFNPLHRALLAEMAGKIDEARAAHQASVFALGGPVGRAAYGAFLERRGDEETARAYYKLLEGEPGPARRAAEAGLARLDRGRASRAYAKVSPSEGAAIAFYSFGAAMIDQAAGQRARAQEAGFILGEPRFNLPLALARIALYLDPKLDEARRLVGTILNVYGDYEGATAALAGIAPSSPHFEQARIEMARGLMAQARPAEAINLLREAIRRDPDGRELRFTLANVYAGQGEHDKAVATLDELIGRAGDEPDDGAWRYYVARGASYLELDRWPDAEADLERAVELAPDEPTALNYLGYSWAERGVNLERAFELIEKAVELEPRSGAIIDSLGWAYYQLGDYEKAVVHLERAAALEPDDATITDHLGDVYWRLGRKTEARYQWRRALELDPGVRLKALIEKKLEKGLASEEGA
ncbi:tetratricopeptide repeat protein [Amphiplicatus metriothermophilus]|uniref:Tetratricopeptide repeat-containing protein n=1 Tax=Amphiplicatus metriothermophilus TaxID=1519374 RepID=A0A239PJ57_9PROT|nr:tetratricopeptide repeat protein [Amphiplicatus metriothermophilus]MBB5518011.1 tetratricopeptide (TPR) repeat protein [Amphiplicatus metriothermophilus]SNT67655.1 Tetratricopeptide repeat-containing protein [Amphiplicatus metriothermophilus]